MFFFTYTIKVVEFYIPFIRCKYELLGKYTTFVDLVLDLKCPEESKLNLSPLAFELILFKVCKFVC